MITSITKRFSFEAAHFLPNHEGKCRNLHGHSYKVEVTVTGKVNRIMAHPEYGMITDFSKLSKYVNNILEPFDHSTLNDFYFNPTAENIAYDIFIKLSDEIANEEFEVSAVKVWETEKCFAEVKAE